MRVDSVVVANDVEDVIPVGAQTVTFNGAKRDGYVNLDSVIFILDVTAQSGTTPTLDVKIQDSCDSGVTWQDTGIVFAQVTTTLVSVAQRSTVSLNSMIRAVCTIGGTTPNYTMRLRAVGKAKKTASTS